MHYGCIHSGEMLIARIAGFSEVASTPETEANARLIAHAPEMYKLLKEVLKAPDFGYVLGFLFCQQIDELLDSIDEEGTKHE